MFSKKRALTVIELLFVSCIIFLLSGIFASYIPGVIRVAREIALRNELTHIRMAIEYYRIMHGTFPASLAVLTKQDLTFKNSFGTIQANIFLKTSRKTPEGIPLDPFMRQYGYDMAQGRVWSQASGYRDW